MNESLNINQKITLKGLLFGKYGIKSAKDFNKKVVASTGGKHIYNSNTWGSFYCRDIQWSIPGVISAGMEHIVGRFEPHPLHTNIYTHK